MAKTQYEIDLEYYTNNENLFTPQEKEYINSYISLINQVLKTDPQIPKWKKNISDVISSRRKKQIELTIANTNLSNLNKAKDSLYLGVGEFPKKKTAIYPFNTSNRKGFFNIPNPSAPFVDIQFRTSYVEPSESYEKVLENPDVWESVTKKNINFFEQLSLEDDGLIRLSLTLTDIHFSKLEDIINRTILNSNFTKKALDNNIKDKEIISLTYDPKYSVNLRLRFGYGFVGNEYLDEVIYNEKFKNRKEISNEKNTVIRTPWLYFQILNITYSINEVGLTANISAVETKDIPLKNLRFVRKNSMIISETGNVEHVIKAIENAIIKLLGNNVELVLSGSVNGVNLTWKDVVTHQIRDERTNIIKSSPIKLMLGDKGSDYRFNNGMKNFGTIHELLTELCNQIQPLYYNDRGMLTKDPDAAKYQAPFTFFYKGKESGNSKFQIVFGYDDKIALSSESELIRVYEWRDTRNSLITNLSISSTLDFAQLNAPMFDITKQDEIDEFKTLLTTTNTAIGNVTTKKNTENFILVGVAYNPTETDSKGKIISNFRKNMNTNIFSGTIEIPGDPFYLFDEKMQPYKYGIYIYVNRNGYLDENNKYVNSERSYLSGYYLIKNIKHEINASNFKTILEIEKFPLFNTEVLAAQRAGAKELTEALKEAEKKAKESAIKQNNLDKVKKEQELLTIKKSKEILDPTINAIIEKYSEIISEISTISFTNGPVYTESLKIKTSYLSSLLVTLGNLLLNNKYASRNLQTVLKKNRDLIEARNGGYIFARNNDANIEESMEKAKTLNTQISVTS